MAARPDYYKALGVSKNATPDEIKKAYRKLARRYHPDRNSGDKTAEERFKEISEAHDVLSDPEKRKQYYRGTGPFATAGGPGGFDPGAFAGGPATSSPTCSERGAGGAGAPRAQRGHDLETEVRITFEQAIEGAQIPLAVPTASPCPTCRGTGARPGTSPEVCPRCQGRGVEAEGQGLFSISQPCSQCGAAARSSPTRARPAMARERPRPSSATA